MFNMSDENLMSGHGPDLANLGFGPNLEVILAVATSIRAQIVFEPIVNTITTKCGTDPHKRVEGITRHKTSFSTPSPLFKVF
jgi:hypothetical protein